MSDGEITTHYDGSVECMFDPIEHAYQVRGWVDHSGGGQWSPWRKVNGVTSSILSEKPWLAAWAVKVGAEAASAEFRKLPSTDLMKDKKGRMIQIRNIPDTTWDSLVKSFKGAHRERKDSAADIGTLAHEWAEKWAASPSIPLPDDLQVRECCASFLRWVGDHRVEVKYAESRVVSRQHSYAGTVDLIAVVNGRLMLADIKTSNRISDSYWLQTAAYAMAWREERSYPLPRGILRLPKEGGEYEWVERQTYHDSRDEAAFLASLSLSRWYSIEGSAR